MLFCCCGGFGRDDIFFFFAHFYFPASGQAVVTGVIHSPRFLPSFLIAHRVQQSHCSSIFHRVLLLTHALAFSASQFVRKKKSPRIYTRMHSGGVELTKLTRIEYNLIRDRGDRPDYTTVTAAVTFVCSLAVFRCCRVNIHASVVTRFAMGTVAVVTATPACG